MEFIKHFESDRWMTYSWETLSLATNVTILFYIFVVYMILIACELTILDWID